MTGIRKVPTLLKRSVCVLAHHPSTVSLVTLLSIPASTKLQGWAVGKAKGFLGFFSGHLYHMVFCTPKHVLDLF